jgi:hypothetical protein
MQNASPFLDGRQRALMIVLFVGISVLHFLTAYVPGPASNWAGKTSEYYPLLTDAFLAGKTSLLVEPDPRLLALRDPYDPNLNGLYRLHDASLYKGKYFLYFGPTPVLTLFLPFKVLTGFHLPTRAAVALFCIGGYACACALFFLLAYREKWLCPTWLGATAVLSLGTSSFVFFLLIRPSFYEVAISAGYCFVTGGFLLLAHSVGPAIPWTPGLFLAGLGFGLAAGCRPNFSLVAVIVAILLSFRIYRHWRGILLFVFPIAVCGLLLAWYNYQRFQSPFEFGMRYVLLGSATDYNEHFAQGLTNLLPTLYYLVLAPVWRYEGFYDPAMGLLWGSPIAAVGLFTPLVLRAKRIRDAIRLRSTRFAIYCLYAAGIGILAPLAVLKFRLGRYNVDFAPEFVLLSWCLLAALWQKLQAPGRRDFQIIVGVLATYSVVLDLWYCLQPRSF